MSWCTDFHLASSHQTNWQNPIPLLAFLTLSVIQVLRKPFAGNTLSLLHDMHYYEAVTSCMSSHWKIVQRHYLPFSFTVWFSGGKDYARTVCHYSNSLSTFAFNISTGTTSVSVTVPCLIILATGVSTTTIDPLGLLFEHLFPYSFLRCFYWIIFHKITTVCWWLYYFSMYYILTLHRFTNPYYLAQN